MVLQTELQREVLQIIVNRCCGTQGMARPSTLPDTVLGFTLASLLHAVCVVACVASLTLGPFSHVAVSRAM